MTFVFKYTILFDVSALMILIKYRFLIIHIYICVYICWTTSKIKAVTTAESRKPNLGENIFHMRTAYFIPLSDFIDENCQWPYRKVNNIITVCKFLSIFQQPHQISRDFIMVTLFPFFSQFFFFYIYLFIFTDEIISAPMKLSVAISVYILLRHSVFFFNNKGTP